MAKVRVIATEENYDDVEIITTDKISAVGAELLSEEKSFENEVTRYVIRFYVNDAICINNTFYRLWSRNSTTVLHNKGALLPAATTKRKINGS